MTRSEKQLARLERERKKKLKLKKQRASVLAPADNDIGEIEPGRFYRKSVARKFFGYGSTMLEEKIKSGELPTPRSLDDYGRACGWYGRTIIAHQKMIDEKGQLNLPAEDGRTAAGARSGKETHLFQKETEYVMTAGNHHRHTQEGEAPCPRLKKPGISGQLNQSYYRLNPQRVESPPAVLWKMGRRTMHDNQRGRPRERWLSLIGLPHWLRWKLEAVLERMASPSWMIRASPNHQEALSAEWQTR